MQEIIECELRLAVSLLELMLFTLIVAGFLVIVFGGLPCLLNAYHTQIVSYRSFLAERVPAWFTFKFETLDMFAAFNPINVSVHTGALDTERIRGIQLTFDGASGYFPGDYNFSDPHFFPEQFNRLQKSLESNILHLEQNSLTTFSGRKENLTYTSGGEFEIGITITYRDGQVVGYGLGDTSYAMRNAIRILPPEALTEFRGNNQRTGLAWLAAGLALIAIGLAGVINLWISLLKH